MRDLIVTENITLDGVIDAPEGWFGVADDGTSTSPMSRRRCGNRARLQMRCSSGG